jgi:hypothetical protein
LWNSMLIGTPSISSSFTGPWLYWSEYWSRSPCPMARRPPGSYQRMKRRLPFYVYRRTRLDWDLTRYN